MSASPGQILSLSFSNPDNRCYANATVHSLLWVAANVQTGLLVSNLQMLRTLSWMCRKPQQVNLWQLRSWCALTCHWANPTRQHDAGEFLQFLGGVIASGGSTDAWQTRLMCSTSAVAQVTDHGQMFPLTLPQDSQSMRHPSLAASHMPSSLQQLIVAWRNQASRHAAVTLPTLLPVQVGRFDDAGTKVHFALQLSPADYIPYFVDATTKTSSHRYCLIAAVYHLGHHKSHGHYRAAFFCNGALTHVADDGSCPTKATASDLHEVQTNVYLIMLCRAEQVPDA